MADSDNPPTTSTSSAANCTCGQCIDGWFSARMKDRLEAETDFLQFAALDLAADLESGTEDVLTPEGLLTEQYVNSDTSLHYIPTSLYEKMTPAFLHGYIIVLQAVLHILLEDFEDGVACIPTIDALTARVNEILSSKAGSSGGDGDADEPKPADITVLKTYIDAGGKVGYALDAVTDAAYEKSPVGGQYHRHQHVREEEADFAKEVGNLPSCANDLAFKLLRSKLGLFEEGMGPHWIFLSDDEGDSEDGSGEAVYEGLDRKESDA